MSSFQIKIDLTIANKLSDLIKKKCILAELNIREKFD